MPASKDYQEKIDVLDIIISILKDHEESLSKIADRFDALSSSISEFEEKASILDRIIEHLGGNKIKNIVSAIGTKGHLVTVNCKSWQAFKGASQGSLLLAYEIIDDMIMLSSVTDIFIFSFPMSVISTGPRMSVIRSPGTMFVSFRMARMISSVSSSVMFFALDNRSISPICLSE
ncbi:hypothetical protein KEJ33_04990 [Candidatus Bathyarchaeota archaeon]|nr:hypothetical protein [Candidatus Bathyarchaeota archaeon]